MRFLLDENISDRRLAARLRAQGHDPILAMDVGLLSVSDATVLIWAIAHALPVLTPDHDEIEDLHDLQSLGTKRCSIAGGTAKA
jgi:hypothetical protein